MSFAARPLGGSSQPFLFNQAIASDSSNYNIRTAALAAGWNGSSPLIATVTILTGVVVSATGNAVNAFRTDSGFPLGSSLAVINQGFIVGCGGDGAYGGVPGDGGFLNGSPGGTAFYAEAAVTITNTGTIAGGGGGGGRGGSGYEATGPAPFVEAGGGGGGRSGRTNALGGPGIKAGTDGTYTTAGTGGAATTRNGGTGGKGGNGGGWGAAGATGSAGSSGSGRPGGSGGLCMNGNSFVTWNTTGTRIGGIV